MERVFRRLSTECEPRDDAFQVGSDFHGPSTHRSALFRCSRELSSCTFSAARSRHPRLADASSLDHRSTCVPGRGLDADRYFAEAGFLSKKPGYGGREVTLIELEAVEALLVLKSGERFGIKLAAAETRQLDGKRYAVFGGLSPNL
jgi:hypothetical protein